MSVNASDVSLATGTSSTYDGFATVQDPRQYLDAPPMLITDPDEEAGKVEHTYEMSGIVDASVSACKDFHIMSSKEFQNATAELSALDTRINDLVAQLDVEHKMREAASSLSKLHLSNQTTPGREPRLSRIFSPGRDKRRLSRQAEDEVEISKQRIDQLEHARFELSQRKNTLETRIVRHHAAVLALSMLGRPLPTRADGSTRGSTSTKTHKHTASTTSTRTQSSRNSLELTQTPSRPRSQRLSMLVGDFDFSPLPSVPSTPRNIASVSNSKYHHDVTSPSYVPNDPFDPTHPKHQPSQGTLRGFAPTGGANSSLSAEELDNLVSRITTALPSVTPNPDKHTFILSAFDFLMRDSSNKGASLDALQLQANQAEQRIAYLTEELRKAEVAAPKQSTDVEHARSVAESTQMATALDQERKRSAELKTRVDAQRAELEKAVASLEDITQLAVTFEAQRTEYDAVIEQLEKQVSDLRSQKTQNLTAQLDGEASTSILCKSFRDIVSDLDAKHYAEIKQLRYARLEAVRNNTSAQPESLDEYQDTSAHDPELHELGEAAQFNLPQKVSSPRVPNSGKELQPAAILSNSPVQYGKPTVIQPDLDFEPNQQHTNGTSLDRNAIPHLPANSQANRMSAGSHVRNRSHDGHPSSPNGVLQHTGVPQSPRSAATAAAVLAVQNTPSPSGGNNRHSRQPPTPQRYRPSPQASTWQPVNTAPLSQDSELL